MALHEIDRNLLSYLSKKLESYDPFLSMYMLRVLGISAMLSPRLIKARKRRKLDISHDPKTQELYQRILWLSREGLWHVETMIIERANKPLLAQELGRGISNLSRVMAAKLRASFYHVFCLFHNQQSHSDPDLTSAAKQPRSSRHGSGEERRRKHDSSPQIGNENIPPGFPSNSGRKGTLRDAIPSMASEASYVTNPYATTISPPPGFGSQDTDQARSPPNVIIPAMNYIPIASSAFAQAQDLATQLLSGSNPLRVSVALEHCAFTWDVLQDYRKCRRLARRSIRDVTHEETTGFSSQAEFEDTAKLVMQLGKFLSRADAADTPRSGPDYPSTAALAAIPSSSELDLSRGKTRLTMNDIQARSPSPVPEIPSTILPDGREIHVLQNPLPDGSNVVVYPRNTQPSQHKRRHRESSRSPPPPSPPPKQARTTTTATTDSSYYRPSPRTPPKPATISRVPVGSKVSSSPQKSRSSISPPEVPPRTSSSGKGSTKGSPSAKPPRDYYTQTKNAHRSYDYSPGYGYGYDGSNDYPRQTRSKHGSKNRQNGDSYSPLGAQSNGNSPIYPADSPDPRSRPNGSMRRSSNESLRHKRSGHSSPTKNHVNGVGRKASRESLRRSRASPPQTNGYSPPQSPDRKLLGTSRPKPPPEGYKNKELPRLPRKAVASSTNRRG